VSGGLLGGPVGSALIRRWNLRASESVKAPAVSGPSRFRFVADVAELARGGRSVLVHAVVLLACVKLGASVSRFVQGLGITFPVYMGAMLLGVGLRNLADLALPGRLRTEIFDGFGSVALGVFLTVAMLSLNLAELGGVAHAMLPLLAAQVALMALFARLVTFPVMGRDYDAAVMAAGHCGFGLGAMPSAMANMQALAERHGHAPRAFLVLPITGTFLIDLVNAANITAFLNALR
jgi:ESS family glutamate:Na+ symporter